MWVWVNLFLSGKQENTLLSNDPIFLVRSLAEGQDGHVRQRFERCWGVTEGAGSTLKNTTCGQSLRASLRAQVWLEAAN